jgi:glycosyltransferase involved in cell wall biosynthesis
MTKLVDTFVSAVLIGDIYSAELTQKIKRTAKLLSANYANYELLVIDNGVREEMATSIRKLLPAVACVRVIQLAKIVDTDTAIFAGVEAAIGDHIVVLYNGDPEELVTKFVERNRHSDIVFGLATNLQRKDRFATLGSKLFYWYNRRYLKIDIPEGSTYYVCINRSVANAMTRGDRQVRHFRHLARLVGFTSEDLSYNLPETGGPYSHDKDRDLILKAMDTISSYSNHPLRVLSYFGIFASLLNVLYAVYVVLINISGDNVAKGWTTLSLQSSLMFCLLFILVAILAEYIGKVLIETRREQPYHIMHEYSSTISIADETRRNVTK